MARLLPKGYQVTLVVSASGYEADRYYAHKVGHPLFEHYPTEDEAILACHRQARDEVAYESERRKWDDAW